MNFRILSFNVWALMPPIGHEVMPRMRAIGDALPGLSLDVAALQEVWDASARSALIDAGKRAGLAHAWHRAAANTGSGLLVLSRHPIASARFEAFELGGWPEAITHADYWGGKGIAELTLTTPVGDLRLFDTHLHAAYSERASDPYIGHRIGQVLQLAERIAATQAPVIAAGDFNFEEPTEEYALLTGVTGAIDIARELDSCEVTVMRANPYRAVTGTPDERIDYLFSRNGKPFSAVANRIARVLTEAFEIDGQPASFSDHAGLIADFELGPSTGPAPTRSPGTLELARAQLEAFRAQAAERRDRQRTLGAAALATGVGAWLARQRNDESRRAFVRGLLTALVAGSGVFGAGELVRSEGFRAQEIAGFDAALERIERLRGGFSSSAV